MEIKRNKEVRRKKYSEQIRGKEMGEEILN
jgi:hypothetical protein